MNLDDMRKRGYELPDGYHLTEIVSRSFDLSDENVIATAGEPLSTYRYGWILTGIDNWEYVTDVYSRSQIDCGVVAPDRIVAVHRQYFNFARTIPIQGDEHTAMLEFFGAPAGTWPGYKSRGLYESSTDETEDGG